MAKKDKVGGAPIEGTAPTTTAPDAEKAASAAVRGLKGIPLTAKITLLISENPKRAGSKSFDRFAAYKDGQTVDEALKAGVITPDLAYDAAHSFIAIEGYVPKLVEKKVKAVKEAKPAKEKKVKAAKSAEQVAAESDLATATKEETMD